MKTVVISDLHGRSIWKYIITEEDDADKIIFIGDYFDSFDIKGEKQIHNFKDIIYYKKANLDKVILFIGNHDHQYMDGISHRCSGFQDIFQFHIREELRSAMSEGLMQICYIHGNYLFSHSGITKTWCENSDVDMNNIEQSINDIFKYKPRLFVFTTGKECNIYGDEICQTPIWVRPKSLMLDKVDGYIQIVGHTVQDKLCIDSDIILTDTLSTSKEYLVITDGKMAVKQVIS